VDDLALEFGLTVTFAGVVAALEYLQQCGLVTNTPPDLPLARGEAAYLCLSGVNEHDIASRLPRAACRVITLGGEAAKLIEDTLLGFGIQSSKEAPFRLVVARDYMDPRLSAINQRCLAEGNAWILVRPYGLRHWIGPLFVPGKTGCWSCLIRWLMMNGWTASSIVAEVPALTNSTLALAAVQAAKWLLTEGIIESEIRELDTSSLSFTRHGFAAYPQCPQCRYASCRVVNLSNIASPLTGVAKDVQIVRNWRGLTVASAKTSQVLGVDGAGGRYYLEHQATFGAAELPQDATTVCLAEAAERYSARFHGDERIAAVPVRELEGSAIALSTLALASDSQLSRRGELNSTLPPRLRIPHSPAPDAPGGWAEAVSLISGERRYVPAAYVYMGYDPEFPADTNGCAAGVNVENARLAGLHELIERDAVSIWWYNRVSRPPVDISAIRSRRIEAAFEAACESGRSVQLLDLTTDFGIPVCVAIGSSDTRGILLGLAAHSDPECCVWKALAEMMTGLAVLDARVSGRHQWLEDANINDFPHLVPAGSPIRYESVQGDSPPVLLSRLIDRVRSLYKRRSNNRPQNAA
jgi:ribosomal protein S12 methylthiotransferase accessory factor